MDYITEGVRTISIAQNPNFNLNLLQVWSSCQLDFKLTFFSQSPGKVKDENWSRVRILGIHHSSEQFKPESRCL